MYDCNSKSSLGLLLCCSKTHLALLSLKSSMFGFKVLKFGKGAKKFVNDFFDGIIEKKPVKEVPNSNPSFSHVAVEIARSSYPYLDSSEYPIMERFLVHNFSNISHDKCNFLGAKRRDEIFNKCRIDNGELFRKYVDVYNPALLGYV